MNLFHPGRGPQGRWIERSGAEVAAIILAIGIATALNVITTFALIEAVFHPTGEYGLSENATQVLTGWGGGMLGVLGAFVGYAFGKKAGENNGGGIPEAPRPPKAPQPPRSPEQGRPGQAGL